MSDKNLDDPSEELKSKISDYILKSGFPLEYQVRELLIKINAQVSKQTNTEIEHHATFIDPDDHKLRETDLFWYISSWHDEQPMIHYTYYIECKSSEKYSWVFFTEPSPEYSSWQSHSTNLLSLEILSDLHLNPTGTIGSPIFYSHSNRLAYSYLTYPESSPDNIRSAIFQAIKPGFVDHQLFLNDQLNGDTEYITSAALFFPVVVYSGYMFEFIYDPQTSSHKLIPADHVVVRFEHSFNGHRFMFLVDVVRSDFVSNYLNQQVQDITKIHDYMEQTKPTKTNIKISKFLHNGITSF